jgi:hypothetical protein
MVHETCLKEYGKFADKGIPVEIEKENGIVGTEWKMEDL